MARFPHRTLRRTATPRRPARLNTYQRQEATQHGRSTEERIRHRGSQHVCKFNAEDVADLRTELLQSGLDSWQAAELISSFLSARGYGISTDGARSVVTGMDTLHSSLESMHQQLEQLALVM